MNKLKKNKPIILIYGIDKIGYSLGEDVETDLYILHFEPFDTEERFQDYDGVILFQGIFETYETRRGLTIKCHREELQRRKKQMELLIENNRFICFILINPFLDRDEDGDSSDTDLVKCALTYPQFYRKNFSSQITTLRTVRNEFNNFIKQFGAAWTEFTYYHDALDIKEICKCGNSLTGMILWNKEFYVPSLKPQRHELVDYLNELSCAVINSHGKLSEELPDWVDEYQFEEENKLLEEKQEMHDGINMINEKLLQFREYKKCLCYDGELLRESVIKIFRDGFGFKIDATDLLKEDFKIIDNDGKGLVLFEIKGTNKGVTREYVNQADSHRERVGLSGDFPSILIVNSNIKKSGSIEDKYQEVAEEQIKHAVKMNVLVLRTIDLINILYLKEKGTLTAKNFLEILSKENGHLEALRESWKVKK